MLCERSNISDVAESLMNSCNVQLDQFSNDTNEDMKYENLPLSLLKGFALMMIMLVTIVGNALVLLAVLMNAHLRTTTNYFIVNLALADLLLGLTVLPLSSALELTKKWLFGEAICTMWVTLDVLSCTASINSLCVISVDRYIGITRPLTYSSIMTKKRAKICCFFIWFVSSLISVGQILGFRETSNVTPYECRITDTKQYVMFSVLGSFYIPSTIILFLYYKIYVAAAKQSRFLRTGIKVAKSPHDGSCKDVVLLRVHTGGQSRHGKRDNSHCGSPYTNECKASTNGMNGKFAKFRRQKKAAKTLGIVVGVYVLCWSPFFIMLPVKAFCSYCNIPSPLFDFVFWLGYCNSCLNPIIYTFSSRDFKKAFKKILRFQCCFSHGRNLSLRRFDRKFLPSTSCDRNSISNMIQPSTSNQKEYSSYEMRQMPRKCDRDHSVSDKCDDKKKTMSKLSLNFHNSPNTSNIHHFTSLAKLSSGISDDV